MRGSRLRSGGCGPEDWHQFVPTAVPTVKPLGLARPSSGGGWSRRWTAVSEAPQQPALSGPAFDAVDESAADYRRRIGQAGLNAAEETTAVRRDRSTL